MKAATISILLLTCALAAPSFGQQKIYNWVSGNDETVRLDPGYYHTSTPYQPAHGARSMQVDIDAQQPVTVAVVSLQDWSDATQRPESIGGLSLFCVQEHVLQTTYSCDVPLGTPMLLLVRDERGERAVYAGRGEVTRGRDYDRQQAAQTNRDRAPAPDAGRDRDPRVADRDLADTDRYRDRPPDADRDRQRHDLGQAITAGVDAWMGRTRRQFAYPNDVHIQYYDWACTNNCNLPDPLRPKLFDWVPGDTQVDRLDPGEFFHGNTWNFPEREVTYHLDVDARQPVTLAVVEAQDWYDGVAQNAGKNLSNINYICIQQHVVKATFACTVPTIWRPTFMVVLDERDPLPQNQSTQAAGTGVAQNAVAKVGQPATPPGGQGSAKRVVERLNATLSQNAALSVPVPPANASAAVTSPLRPFLAPNDIRIKPYFWRCVDACDQPDYGWSFEVNESHPLEGGLALYGSAVIPDHDGEPISIHVKSPVPMAVAMLRPKAANRLVSQPDQLESAVEKSSCVQRGVQESSFQCTFNVKDGPQSLVVVPEPGVDIPEHKKAEVSLQAFKCVDNCPGPIYGWVGAVHEKYLPTKILKMYGGFIADHDGAQVSVKIKSPVPMAAAMLPTREAGQLYGKPDLFDSELQNSSCQKRNVLDAFFECTVDLADGSQSLVVRPEPGYANQKNKKAEVEIRTVKCVDKCDVSVR